MPGETFVAPAAKIRRFLADRGLAKLGIVAARAAAPSPATPDTAPVVPAAASTPAAPARM
jgi:serine protease Do